MKEEENNTCQSCSWLVWIVGTSSDVWKTPRSLPRRKLLGAILFFFI